MDLFGTAAHWFGRGGFVMYLLLLASIGAVSIIIERARYYRRKRQRFHFFIQQWRKDAAVYDVSELAVRYGKSHRVLNRLAAAACHAAENGRSVEIAIESAAQLEAAKLKRGLPLLGCLVTLAPILGLMGTVIGMIQSFSVFNLQSGGAPSPAALARPLLPRSRALAWLPSPCSVTAGLAIASISWSRTWSRPAAS